MFKLDWILKALSREPVDDESITTVFEVHGYRMDIPGSGTRSISFRIKVVRHCDWISGKIMSVDGVQRLGNLVFYQSSLGDADVDCVRFRFRITNDIVLEQLQLLHLTSSQSLEVELKRGETRWIDVESVRGPRSNQAKPNRISTRHLSTWLLDKFMRNLHLEKEDSDGTKGETESMKISGKAPS